MSPHSSNLSTGSESGPEPKPASSTSNVSPRVPFVIGVTGNMDPVGYDDDFDTCYAAPEMQQLRSQLFDILDWVTGLGKAADGRCLDPATGLLRQDASCAADSETAYHSCWKPLALAKGPEMSVTPIVILSSLAPGVDTIMVEAALDYAIERGAEVKIRCPLPFPEKDYPDASTFNSDAKKKRFNEVVEKLKASPGFQADRDLFDVALDNDLSPAGSDPKVDLNAMETSFQKPMRHLRYRAAGEYVATHSDLLIAIYDVPFDAAGADLTNIFEAGTATIVESKRVGLTHELLAVSNNFAWADNGPVLVVPIHREKHLRSLPAGASELGKPGHLRLLHPYDTQPGGLPGRLPDDEPRWQRAGHELFCRILERQKEFNALPENPKESVELAKMVGDKILDDTCCENFAKGFEGIARVRRRAADRSAELDKARLKLLQLLVGLIFFAALSFGAFEHWHNHAAKPLHHGEHPHWWVADTPSIIQCVLLMVTMGCLLASGMLYHRYLGTKAENQRFDYRAIGEALRVQFYWLLTGTGRGVAADYMQRQRDELDWIRYIVSSLAIPIEVSRRDFMSMSHSTRHRLLHTAFERWIVEQKNYFVKNAPKREKQAHRFHTLGWTFAAAGLISIIGMFLAELSPLAATFLHHHYVWFGLVGLVVGMTMLWVKCLQGKKHEGGHGAAGTPPRFLRWICGDVGIWGGALAIHSLVILAAFTIGLISLDWPDAHNSWIILTGGVLLGGALSIAWAERNFFGEEGRIFRSMGNLYTCAERRLKPLLERYERSTPEGPEAARLLFEIQDIYYQIGCEALDENAEWLIQHRSRPLEPFMGG